VVVTVEPKLYKVLDEHGRSHGHGGASQMQWSLPKNGKPGDWHVVKGDVKLCGNGLHVTDRPEHWYKDGCRVFEVEAEIVDTRFGDRESKAVAKRVRLVREIAIGCTWVFGYGYGYGSGYGYGYGDGYGYGYGYGSGDGYGYGSGSGSGSGYGSGADIVPN
jgi:hypothetical protein